jgi:hypothetical protein
MLSTNTKAAPVAYTPQQALADVLSSPLEFVGKGLLYGYQSIESCLFRNDKVLVLDGYCTKTEVGAADLIVYSMELKQALQIHAESNGNFTPISQTNPAKYPPNYWYADLRETGPDIHLEISFSAFADLYQNMAQNQAPDCLVSAQFSTCAGNPSYTQDWLSEAESFRKSPGKSWHQVLLLLKNSAHSH